MAKAYFVDRVGVLDKLEYTPQGGARVPARLARPGVLPYSTEVMRRQPNNKVPREYLKPVTRIYTSPEVLVAALDTLREAPVTREHPPKMVDPSNFSSVSKGVVSGSSVEFDGKHIKASLVVQDAQLLEDIEHNVRREVSLGYYSDVTFGEGVSPEGEAYDAIRTDIFYNHAAVVSAGRAGASVCLALDSADIVLEETVKIKGKEVATDAAQAAIDGVEAELAVKVSEVDSLKSEIAELKAKLTKAESQETKDSWLAEKADLEKKAAAKVEKVTKLKAAGVAVADDASDAFIDTALAVMDALKKSDPDGLKDLKTLETTDAKETPKVKVDARAKFLASSREMKPLED